MEKYRYSHNYKFDPDLLEYIPWFVQRREAELGELNYHLYHKNFSEIQKIGHAIKGFGASFGLLIISHYGEAIEKIAETKQKSALQMLFVEYEQLVAELKEDFGL